MRDTGKTAARTASSPGENPRSGLPLLATEEAVSVTVLSASASSSLSAFFRRLRGKFWPAEAGRGVISPSLKEALGSTSARTSPGDFWTWRR